MSDMSLLESLRQKYYNWREDVEKSLLLLVNHQHEFPIKIREFIQEAKDRVQAGESIVSVMFHLNVATKYYFFFRPKFRNDENDESIEVEALWYGPDIEVDKEEQIEAALRFFPHLLGASLTPREGEWGLYVISRATASLKSLPFVPLIAELSHQYQVFEDEQRAGLWKMLGFEKSVDTALVQIVENKIILRNQSLHNDHFYRQIDDVSLSVLVRLRQKGFISKVDIWECVKILVNEAPSRTEKRLQFFLDWDPTILKTKNDNRVEMFYSDYCNSLLEYFIWECYRRDNVEGMLERFQTLFEFGLKNYPDKIGFLFHKDLFPREKLHGITPKIAFPMACEMFGQEKNCQSNK